MGLVGITNAIVSLRGLIIIPILTKTLGADAYGVWSVIIHLAIIASGAFGTDFRDDTVLSSGKR